MDLDQRRLRLLLAVAEHGSLTEAAHAAALTTSAVSQQISKLEREVGVPLLERGPRGVVLTEAGQVLAQHAASIDRLLAAAAADMEDFRGLRRGSLRLATFPTVAAALMPAFVARFREHHPDVTLQVRSARIGPILGMLARHEVDLATLWDYPWLPLHEPGLEIVTLTQDPSLLLVSDNHPLADRRRIGIGELRQEAWITRAEHPVADVLAKICADAGFAPTIAFTVADYQELQAMVAARFGVALAPRLVAVPPRQGVRAIELVGNPEIGRAHV